MVLRFILNGIMLLALFLSGCSLPTPLMLKNNTRSTIVLLTEDRLDRSYHLRSLTVCKILPGEWHQPNVTRWNVAFILNERTNELFAYNTDDAYVAFYKYYGAQSRSKAPMRLVYEENGELNVVSDNGNGVLSTLYTVKPKNVLKLLHEIGTDIAKP